MSSGSPKLKIALCTHVFSNINYEPYLNHILCVSHWMQKYDLVPLGMSGLNAATSRNRIADAAIEEGCTHMFFMDADHIFPLETLDCLVESAKEAIVSGLVCKRGETYSQVGFVKKDEKFCPVDLPLDGSIYQVSVCAFGCTLVSTHFLKRLEKPYFRDVCRDLPDGEKYNFRSDIILCEQLAEIGGRCFIDTRVLVGHHGLNRTVYPQNAAMVAQADRMARESVALRKEQKGYCSVLS